MIMLDTNNCDEWQLHLLREFQKRVADLKQNEITCLRFLIAREFKMDLAEQMLRNSLKWRHEVGIENYSKWTVSEVPEDDFVFKITGVSHKGGPVLWVPLGKWNGRYWIEKGKQEETKLYGYRILETVFQRLLNNNQQVVAILGIETLNYYKVSHIPTLKTLYDVFHALEQNYPEILQSVIIVNAPWMFSIGFNFIKPILSPRTLSKIQVFKAQRDKWLAALREQMPDSAIPSEYLKDNL